MQLDLHIASFDVEGGTAAIAPTLTEVARTAEEAGVAALSLMDHFFQLEGLGGAEHPMLEGYTGLGYLAGVTERIELGLLVTGVTYRHPGLLAKTVATLDVLSGGRAYLGLGAAWYEREHVGLGVPFPPLGERFERLEETLQICAQMFSDDDGPYEGRHFQLAETICLPRPIRRPPVMIGGGGERKTLRLVAQYADASNLIARDRDEVAHKLEVLQRHCETLGRDPAEIQRTILAVGDPLEDADAFLREMEHYAGLGVEQVAVIPRPPDLARWTTEACERLHPRLLEL